MYSQMSSAREAIEYQDMTIKELREKCKEQGIRASGKKEDLIARLIHNNPPSDEETSYIRPPDHTETNTLLQNEPYFYADETDRDMMLALEASHREYVDTYFREIEVNRFRETKKQELRMALSRMRLWAQSEPTNRPLHFFLSSVEDLFEGKGSCDQKTPTGFDNFLESLSTSSLYKELVGFYRSDGKPS